MGIDQVIGEVLHTVLDVLSGKQAHLSQAAADALHEKISPGHTDVPLTAAEQAQLADLEARRARLEAEQAARAAAPAAADEGSPGESVAANTAG